MLNPLRPQYEKMVDLYVKTLSEYSMCPQHHEPQMIKEFLKGMEVIIEELRDRLRRTDDKD